MAQGDLPSKAEILDSLRLFEHTTDSGQLRFLVGRGNLDVFDILVQLLRQQHLEPVEFREIVWLKIVDYVLPSGERFRLVHDSAYGLEAYSLSQSPAANAEIRQILHQVLADGQDRINALPD